MPKLPPLPPLDVAGRAELVRDRFEGAEIASLIVSSPTNIRWLTGFSGSSATVVVTRSAVHLFTDSRYALRAPQELAGANSEADVTVAARGLGEAVRDVLADDSDVGVEADHITWARSIDIATKWLPDHELTGTTELIDQLRAVKSDAEIARIEAAAELVDGALADVAPQLTAGPTERDFARELDAQIRRAGADDLAFDTIVASGPNGAIPHHQPGDRQIGRGDFVIVDVGAKVDGYRSDMTRTFCVGALTPEQQHHYDVVIEAQQAGVDAMVADVETRTVDGAARDVIDAAGWGGHFQHGTGHGVGLDIHEMPRVASWSPDHYRIGTVATVEPGVYLPAVAGVRIEDTCVVTAEGARRLTKYPKVPELL